MLNEYKNKYKILDTIPISYYYGEKLENVHLNRSICRYFLNIVGSFLDMIEVPINNELKEMLRLFGVLRQITDEIADFEEDLNQGLVTLPTLYIKEKVTLNLIEDYWKGKVPYNEVWEVLINYKIFENCFSDGINIYARCNTLKNQLIKDYIFIDALFVFYDLKLCLLYRLKNNGWKDNKKIY